MNPRFAVVITIFLSIFALINYYIGWHAQLFLSHVFHMQHFTVWWICYWLIAFSYIIGRLGSRYLPYALSSVLKKIAILLVRCDVFYGYMASIYRFSCRSAVAARYPFITNCANSRKLTDSDRTAAHGPWLVERSQSDSSHLRNVDPQSRRSAQKAKGCCCIGYSSGIGCGQQKASGAG